MSCFYRIEQYYEHLTPTEKIIADFIMHNTAQALEAGVNDLAALCGVSPPSIIRFYRRIGYDKYSEMKVNLAMDVANTQCKCIDNLIQSSDTLENMSEKAVSSISQTLNNTLKLVKTKELRKAINAIKAAECIYLFGIGASGIAASDLFQKLIRINRRCSYFEDSNLALASAVHINSKDAAIFFSYGGKTRETNMAAQAAKKNGATCIAITTLGKSPLSSLADIVLPIPSDEPEIRIGALQSRYAQLLVLDLLYIGLIQNDLPQIEEYLEKTRAIVKGLKSD